MKQFVRITKLSNIGGRADYITNEKSRNVFSQNQKKLTGNHIRNLSGIIKNLPSKITRGES